MSIKNLETKKCRGRASKLPRFLHREGKKYCAVALCASLIAGNLGSSAVAADESTVHEFELDRVALYEALQEAVMADEIVDGAFTFAGEAADTYDSLFNSEGNGNLYELKPEIEDNGGALSLRIFARLDGEIEFDSAYEIDGTEEMIFLLTNTSKEEKTAVISVDGKRTEEIKVAPKSAVSTNEADKSLSDLTDPGVNGETAEAPDGIVISGGSSSSGGGSGSGGGGGSHGGGNSDSSIVESGSSANEENETSEGASTTDPEQGDVPAAGEDQETGESQENDESQGGGIGDNNKTEESADAGENGNKDPEGGDDTTTGDNQVSNTDGNQPEGNDNSTSAGDSEKGNSEEGGTEDKGEDSNDTGSNGQESSNEGSDSNTSGDPQDDAGEAGSGDDSMAAVSYHKTYLVAATPSNAEEDEEEVASPSDASDSNADENMLDGIVYDTVLMDGTAVAAFAITFADLAMDEIDLEELATDSDAIRVYRMELEDVSVEVRALKGTFPENVELEVTKLSDDDEKYEATKEALNNSGVQYDGLLAYDVTFYDEDGSEIEPDGDVSVALELKKKALDNYVDLNSLTVQHLKETEDGIKIEAVADVNNDTAGTVEVNEDTLVTAKFGLDSFSVLAVPYATNEFTVTSVAIKDDILSSGSLVADVTGTGNLDSATYQWYISDNGRSWIPIEDTATVDSQKATYYVARDGAQKYFKVAVTGTDGVTRESAGYKVDYYDSLQNGSFETPVVKNSGNAISTYGSSHFLQIPNETEGLEWKTTAKGPKWGSSSSPKDYYIEIADGSRKDYGSDRKHDYNDPSNVYNISSAADGDQFAELNCQVAGALYQDILTQPGSTLYWGLEHAGRQGNDTMAVIISDTKALQDDWNPTENNYNSRPEDVQAVLTDPSGSWVYHTGTYVVPEGQYVTRFYFVAVSAAGGIADGNLLDNISFSKEVPNPPSAKGNLIINKEVNGIDQANVPAEAFEFEVKQGTTVVRTVKLPTASGAWSAVADSLDPGQYTITEKSEGLDSLTDCNYVGTTYRVEDVEANSGLSTKLSIVSKQNTAVTFTNQYERKTQITIKKQVEGYLGDQSKEFAFTASLIVNGETKEFPQGTSTNYTVQGKEAKFELHHNEEVTLTDLPVGAILTIKEANGQYTVSVKQGETDVVLKNDNSVEIALGNTNNLVLFINTYDGLIDTGVLLDSLPYVLILAAVVVGVAFFVIRKRQEDESDLD